MPLPDAPQNQPDDQLRCEEREVQERSAPSGKVVYQAIVAEGAEELKRPSVGLFWSGLAAGLSMGFSMVAETLLQHYLPHEPWRPLVANLGYSVGFLIVVLGRQQLFTENTLTPVLPLLQKPTLAGWLNVGRLWGIVLVANILGALAFALVVAHSTTFEAEIRAEFVHLGQQALAPTFGTTVLRGIFAGWLIALMVWLLPYAEEGRIWIIIILTYVVGVAHFSHVIAGSVEVFTLAALGHTTWSTALGSFTVPALLGNILGGVALVAALNHAQVTAGKEE